MRRPPGNPAAAIWRTSGAANSKALGAKLKQPDWQPDFGPAAPHVSAGASVIGARMPLIAYNINLATNRLDVAKKIATAVRHSSGGLRFVKADGHCAGGPRHRPGVNEPDEL
jgi:glutamate formiminotransferase